MEGKIGERSLRMYSLEERPLLTARKVKAGPVITGVVIHSYREPASALQKKPPRKCIKDYLKSIPGKVEVQSGKNEPFMTGSVKSSISLLIKKRRKKEKKHQVFIGENMNLDSRIANSVQAH